MLLEREDEIEALKSTIQAQKIALIERDEAISGLQDQVVQLQKDQDLCIRCNSAISNSAFEKQAHDPNVKLRCKSFVPFT